MQINPERLKARRKELRISQMELSRRVGIDQSTLSKIENGYPLTDSDIQEKFASVLGVSVQWICGKIESDQSPDDDATPIEHALFSAMDTAKFTPKDFDSARRALREASFLMPENADLVAIARRWLTAAKQLRVEGHPVTAGSIATRAAVGKGEIAAEKAAEKDAVLAEEIERTAREMGLDSTEEERAARAEKMRKRMQKHGK